MFENLKISPKRFGKGGGALDIFLKVLGKFLKDCVLRPGETGQHC